MLDLHDRAYFWVSAPFYRLLTQSRDCSLVHVGGLSTPHERPAKTESHCGRLYLRGVVNDSITRGRQSGREKLLWE